MGFTIAKYRGEGGPRPFNGTIKVLVPVEVFSRRNDENGHALAVPGARQAPIPSVTDPVAEADIRVIKQPGNLNRSSLEIVLRANPLFTGRLTEEQISIYGLPIIIDGNEPPHAPQEHRIRRTRG